MSKNETARALLAALKRLYPQSGPHLAHKNAWELLAATVLSAQCTDERVNRITPALFSRLPGPAAFAAAAPAELEELIRPTGFYRNKARHLIRAAQKILADFGGEVPRSMEKLLTLDGVARKTANVVLSGAFGINEGLAVDTHVARIAIRLELTASKDPKTIELDLLPLFPREEWGGVNHRLVSFGREICKARSPRCLKPPETSGPDCPLRTLCPQKRLKQGR
ncbi:MAG: endonuclease III [Desulfovibrionaceae bacterium]|nr:endonuclease III [Desulfovibrionaceae bacterium]